LGFRVTGADKTYVNVEDFGAKVVDGRVSFDPVYTKGKAITYHLGERA
jgi:hypothetical protein